MSAPPVAQSPTLAPTASPAPTPTPSPTPTPDPVALEILAILGLRDAAQRSSDEAELLALLDASAPAAFRERELGLARVVRERAGPPPVRTLVGYEGGLASPLGVLVATVIETDDQPRSRAVRYFFNTAGATRLSEPTAGALGPLETRSSGEVDIHYHALDAGPAAVAEGYATAGLAALIARLGEEYRPQRRISITLAPATVPGLPAVASGFVSEGRVTLLSSHSMIVASGPGAEWARTVIAHEIAHVLLFQRGRGPFVLVEGIPLWLTDDRRQNELDRLVAAEALWDVEHLVDGPREISEFFAGYAQASSFVRYLAATHGERAVLAAWEGGVGASFENAFRSAFGQSVEEAHAAWAATLRRPVARLDFRAPHGARIISGTAVTRPWPDAFTSPG